MNLSNFVFILGMIFFASELALSLFRRSKSKAQSKDGGSLWLLWVVIFVGVQGGAYATNAWPHTRFPQMERWQMAGCVILLAGLALRWWSILYLGRFFTVNVAVHEGHRVVDSGPYRYVRHPSYTGALIAFLGLSLGFGSWLSVLLVMLPTWLAYAWRIRIEERTLAEALGENYRGYIRRTKRLVPLVY
jgi:protein-S-isoprenylcysteine O-methyltransferase